MINILIVEDTPHKMETIIKLLKEDLMIKDEFVDSVTDIKSAKKLLTTKFYDLLILDLVLPLEKGDTPSPEKGVGFLRDINSNPSLNPPIHIIGLTEFGDLKSKFDADFHSHLWHLINYEATEINWQDKLKNVTYHLISTRNSFFEKQQNDLECDIAIITALNTPEFDFILKLSDNWKTFQLPGDATKYYSTLFSAKNKTLKVIAACADQMGMTATANLSTKICLNFKPKYLFMGGICAGLKERDLNFGDIIIAEQSWDYGSGKMKEIKYDGTIQDIVFEPDPRPIPLCPELKAKINSFLRKTDVVIKIQQEWKSAKPKHSLQAKLGPVASGSYVIASDSILQDIKGQQRKLLGIEMEAYGLYYSAENSPNEYTKPIMIKSVSDFGDASKNDGFQEYAAYTSAQFIYQFILTEL